MRQLKNRNKLLPSFEQLETRQCFDGMPMLWMEDNNLGLADGLPSDFIKRFQDPETWRLSLRTLDTMYLRESSLRNTSNAIDSVFVRDIMAPVLNASQANVSIDTSAATFLNRRARTERVSFDALLDSHFRWVDGMLQSGLRIRTVSLQGVLSKTIPGDPSWSSYSVQDRISDVVEYATRMNARYPWMQIGIIDALPLQQGYTTYGSLRDALNSRSLVLDHIHLEMPVDYIGTGKTYQWSDIYSTQRFVQTSIGSKFGFVLTSLEGGQTSNDLWAQRIIAGLDGYQDTIRLRGNPNLQPDRLIISSWHSFPNTSVPESMPAPTVAGVAPVTLRNTTQSVLQVSNLLRGYTDFVGNGLQNELNQTFPVSAAASSSNIAAGRTPENAVFGRGVVNAVDSINAFQWQAAAGDTNPWLKANLATQTGLGTIRLWPLRGSTPEEGGSIADVYITKTSTKDPVSDPSGWKLVASVDLRGQSDKYVESSMGFNQATAVAIRFRSSVGAPGVAAVRIFATAPGLGNEYVSPLVPRIPDVDVLIDHVVSGQKGVRVASLWIGGQSATFTHQLTVSDSRFEFRGNELYLKSGVSLSRITTPGVAVWTLLTDKSLPSKSFSKLVSFLVYDTSPPQATSDFGDAPISFPVLSTQNGASHIAQGPMLGTKRTAEFNGEPSDQASSSTDDDGVQFANLRAGTVNAQLAVNVGNVTRDTFVQAWIDFNGDGSWSGSDEQIVSEYRVSNGRTVIPFSVPSTARLGISFARVRISTQSKVTPYGQAIDGEVEDYKVDISGAIPSTGSFQVHTVSNKTDGARMVQPVDFDRDGDVDLITASEFENLVRLLINDGNQNFVEKWSGSAYSATTAMTVDIDQDGDLDILATGFGNGNLPGYGHELVLFRNNGGFAFTRIVIATGLTGPYTVTASDMDRDGDIDPVVTATQGGFIKWLENLGANQFVVRDVGTCPSPFFISIADVDEDGDQDILTVPVGQGLILFVNNGTQVFSSRSIGSGFSAVKDAEFCDFDSDGDLDIVLSHNPGNQLILLENLGQLSFAQRVLSNQEFYARVIEIADINGDGLLDVIAAQTDGNAVVWHKNLDGNRFEARYVSRGTEIVQQVTSMDMDRDGDLDILSASWLDDSIYWFEQTGVDRGDAPSSFGEATHSISSLYLGRTVDADESPQPSVDADSDDNDFDGDDDDGVSILSNLRTTFQPYTTSLYAKSSGSGFLDAWIDFNRNGRFDPTTEHLFAGKSVRLDPGGNFISFTVPAGIVSGVATARFRVSPFGGLAPDGSASGGEVEDYNILIEPRIVFPKWWASIPAEIFGPVEITHSVSFSRVVSSGSYLLDQANSQDFGPVRVDGNDGGNLFSVFSNSSTNTLTLNGGAGLDTIKYVQENGRLDLSDNSSLIGISIEKYDVRDGKPQEIELPNESIRLFEDQQTVEIAADPLDVIHFGSDWKVSSPTIQNTEFSHRITKETNFVVLKNTQIWTNPLNKFDVNANGSVDPLDVLNLINFINSSSTLTAPKDDRDLENWRYLDPDRNGVVTPIDVLLVINEINNRSNQ
jgi:hypothetical protein